MVVGIAICVTNNVSISCCLSAVANDIVTYIVTLQHPVVTSLGMYLVDL